MLYRRHEPQQRVCICCMGKIQKDSSHISLECEHHFHYGCFFSMIEYDRKLSYNNCPCCKKDLSVPFFISKEVHKKVSEKCSICMEKLGYTFNIHTTPCDHKFHKKCIDQWVRLKKKCPLCRNDLTGHLINRDNIFINDVPELKTPEPDNIFDDLENISFRIENPVNRQSLLDDTYISTNRSVNLMDNLERDDTDPLADEIEQDNFLDDVE